MLHDWTFSLPQSIPPGKPSEASRRAGGRRRGRGQRRRPRPPLPEVLPQPACRHSPGAPREGRARAALPPPQLPWGRGSPHAGGLRTSALGSPPPRTAGCSGRRGRSGRRRQQPRQHRKSPRRHRREEAGGGALPARPEVPRRYPGWAGGRGRQGWPAPPGLRLSRQPPPSSGRRGRAAPPRLRRRHWPAGTARPRWRRARAARCPPRAASAIGREKAVASAIGRSALPIGAAPRAPGCRPRNADWGAGSGQRSAAAGGAALPGAGGKGPSGGCLAAASGLAAGRERAGPVRPGLGVPAGVAPRPPRLLPPCPLVVPGGVSLRLADVEGNKPLTGRGFPARPVRGLPRGVSGWLNWGKPAVPRCGGTPWLPLMSRAHADCHTLGVCGCVWNPIRVEFPGARELPGVCARSLTRHAQWDQDMGSCCLCSV